MWRVTLAGLKDKRDPKNKSKITEYGLIECLQAGDILVDPAGASQIAAGNGEDAGGLSGVIYREILGLEQVATAFASSELAGKVIAPGQAALYEYKHHKLMEKKLARRSLRVIHVVGPTFSRETEDPEEPNKIEALKSAYAAVLQIAQQEDLEPGAVLRLPIISGGIFAGRFQTDKWGLAKMSVDALMGAIEQVRGTQPGTRTIRWGVFDDNRLFEALDFFLYLAQKPLAHEISVVPKRENEDGVTKEWFKDLTGSEEEELFPSTAGERPPGNGLVRYDQNNHCLHIGDKKTFQTGLFITPTLKELRQVGRLFLETLKRPPGVEAKEMVHLGNSDVRKKHTKHNFALFQAASQFNCLEFISAKITPENGVTNYYLDRTQGPACAIAAGPALIYRNYFATADETTGLLDRYNHTGQRKDNQLDTLRPLLRYLHYAKPLYQGTPEERIEPWTMKNGYLQVEPKQADHLQAVFDPQKSKEDVAKRIKQVQLEAQMQVTVEPAQIGDPQDLLRELVAIGLQLETQVTAGCARPQFVTQALCSAVPLGYKYQPNDPKGEKLGGLAQRVLEAAYEATLWAGVINLALNRRRDKSREEQARQVFLTLLGGGAFRNDPAWIRDAMYRAYRVVVTEQGAPLEVTVLHYKEVDERYVASKPALSQRLALLARVRSKPKI